MKTPSCVAILLFLACQQLSAQSLSGKVLDGTGKGMPFVNILLLNEIDSTLVKGAVSNDVGYYVIENVKRGNYKVAARMVGFKSKPATVTVTDVSVQVPSLLMEEDAQQLKEISIEATRPFIEQSIDRTVVNVSNSIVSGGSTVLEVLEKSPGVSVDRQNNSIALRGKDGVIVIIDGKQTYLSMSDAVAMLAAMSSDNIDRIELITNPPAKYDAAGNSGIINVVLKKNENFGTNGSSTLAGGSGRFDRERASLQLNTRSKKLNLFGNVSASRGGNYWNFDLYRQQDDEQGGWNYVDQDSYIRFRQAGFNGKAGIDYQIAKNTTIGVVYTRFWNMILERSPAGTIIRNDLSPDPYLQIITQKSIDDYATNQIGNFNVQHHFNSNGGTLSADFDIGRFDRDYDNKLRTTTLISDNPPDDVEGLFTGMKTGIDILTFKADYSKKFSEKWRLEVGIKHSSVFSDNDVQLTRGLISNMQPDAALSNRFQYSEKVNAAYASVAGKISNLEIQAGLRTEHTHSIGKSLTLGQRVERDYVNFFPTLFIKRQFAPRQSLVLAYSYRIDRPSYPNLNPARSYLDPYAFSRGNAYLKPQYTHSIELKHGWADKLFTSFSSSYVIDYVSYLILPVDARTSERTPGNIGTSNAYNLTVSYPVELIRGWTFQTNFTGTYSVLKFLYLGESLQVEQFFGRFNGSNSILFGKGWTGELSGWLNTPARNNIFSSPWLGSMDMGVQKSISSKMKIRLSLQDVFKTNHWIAWGDAGKFKQDVNISFDTRVCMLSFSYIFGNQKLKAERQRKTASEEEVQRTN
jgi:hypothetical protein